ncbi:histidinol phosphate phosphatase [Clostridium sp. HMP27]|uniref:histidinol phosphate phosphatase n=1 Tax=Clostridium sp. HMP27 TaxID=1487921 RepID=UPI00052DA4D1|nr:histidinol phosphate phosphatase [Clostridium sp. HMP27]KGK90305.1 histidinol phosphatase [Clostridium sp. HMP27]
MFDSHVHTNFSTDCMMPLEDAISSANKKDIGIIITDHFDLKYMVKDKFIFDIDKYVKEYALYRNEKVLLGIEMGMREDVVDENRAIALKYDLDFILGSVHVVNYDGKYYDIYTEEFYEGRDKKECYINYLEDILKCVKEYDFIDSLGHIDYIARYAPFEDREIYYDDYREHIDEILSIMAKNERAIEINTRRFNKKEAMMNLEKIYKRFKELGGKIVTIGSDSHTTESIGENFDLAIELADLCGLKPVCFKNRKPEYL